MPEYEAKCRKCGIDVKHYVPDDIAKDAALLKAELSWVQCERCEKEIEKEIEHREYRKMLYGKVNNSKDILQASGLPEEFFGYDPAKGNAALLNFVKNNAGLGLWISGPSGEGKTRSIVQAAKGLIERQGVNVKFFEAPTLLRNLSKLYQKDVSQAEEYQKKLYEVELLIIDDLGKESMSDSNRAHLWEIINERYKRFQIKRRGWQLWVTTQDDGSALCAKMGEKDGWATIRRINEICKPWEPRLL